MPIDVERDVAALGGATTVILELHPHLVMSGRDRLRPRHEGQATPKKL